MNKVKALEESFRESACIGDIDTIEELLTTGINVNSKHDINGWTALHWAAKRGHKDIVSLLLHNGANTELLTCNGETPSALCSNLDILKLLDSDISVVPAKSQPLPITPNYLKNPPLNGKVDVENKMISRKHSKGDAVSSQNIGGSNVQMQMPSVSSVTTLNDELVLKVRVAYSNDTDFIEIELPRTELTYSRLLRTCCEELGVAPLQVFRVRKLPNTVVRKDKDVHRLTDFQEMEIVLAVDRGRQMGGGNSTGAANGYQSISQYKNQTILY